MEAGGGAEPAGMEEARAHAKSMAELQAQALQYNSQLQDYNAKMQVRTALGQCVARVCAAGEEGVWCLRTRLAW